MKKISMALLALILFSISSTNVNAYTTTEAEQTAKAQKLLQNGSNELVALYEEQNFIMGDEWFDENGNLIPTQVLDVKYVETSTYISSAGEQYNQQTEREITANEYQNWAPKQTRIQHSEDICTKILLNDDPNAFYEMYTVFRRIFNDVFDFDSYDEFILSKRHGIISEPDGKVSRYIPATRMCDVTSVDEYYDIIFNNSFNFKLYLSSLVSLYFSLTCAISSEIKSIATSSFIKMFTFSSSRLCLDFSLPFIIIVR